MAFYNYIIPENIKCLIQKLPVLTDLTKACLALSLLSPAALAVCALSVILPAGADTTLLF